MSGNSTLCVFLYEIYTYGKNARLNRQESTQKPHGDKQIHTTIVEIESLIFLVSTNNPYINPIFLPLRLNNLIQIYR